MNKKTTIAQSICKNFRHLAVAAAAMVTGAHAVELENIGLYSAIQNRGVANYTPDSQLDIRPPQKGGWLEDAMLEDRAGVMKSIKRDLDNWRTREEYLQVWNLESFGLHNNVPARAEQKRILSKRMLKYLDKRLTSGVAGTPESDRTRKIAAARNSLRPNSSASLSKNLKLKFRAKLLQRKAAIVLQNPWVGCRVDASFQGDAKIKMSKEVAGFAAVANHEVSSGTWESRIERSIASNVRAQISSTQKMGGVPFNKTNTTAGVVYRKGF